MDVIHSVATTLSAIPIMKVLFPLLAIVGPGLFVYYGYRGIKFKRTIFLFRSRSGVQNMGLSVEGTSAVVLGVFYLLVAAPLMLVAMGPIAGAIVGLW